MLVIQKRTEETLFKTLQEHWQTCPTHRCLQLKFSALEDDVQNWFQDVLGILRQGLDDKTAQLYLCDDKDIFILSRYITLKHVNEFLSHLSPVLAPAPLGELASLFEIGVDWPRLRNICQRKIEDLRTRQDKKAVEVAFEERQDKKPQSLNGSLIQSLSARRAQRDIPEILIVENDMFSQKLVGNALKDDYPLFMASDGQDALSSYVTKAPDVLFLDIGLPDMCGHEVLERIFKLDPDAYVVMFSGNGDRENVLKAIELGAKGFVGKPFTQEKLFQYIEKSPFIQAKQNREKTHGYPQC